jgi:hypothetical protein
MFAAPEPDVRFGNPSASYQTNVSPSRSEAQAQHVNWSGCKRVRLSRLIGLYSATYSGCLGPIDPSPAHVNWLSQTGPERVTTPCHLEVELRV